MPVQEDYIRTAQEGGEVDWRGHAVAPCRFSLPEFTFFAKVPLILT